MTPLQVMGEGLKALRARISAVETRMSDFETAVTGAVLTHKEAIEDIYPRLERLEPQAIPLTGEEGVDMIILALNRLQFENAELRAQVEKQDTTIAQIIEGIERRSQPTRITGSLPSAMTEIDVAKILGRT